MRGQTFLYRLDLDAALSDCLAAAELARNIRQARAELIAAIVAGYVLDCRDPAEGMAWAITGLEIARRLGSRVFEASNLENMARFTAQEGAYLEARELIHEAISILRGTESGMLFQGPKALGFLALVTDDDDERYAALQEAKLILGAGAGGDDHLWFYRDAMETCLQTGQWAVVETYATALEEYTCAEPLPWSDLFIGRGRVLAATGRGQRDEEIRKKLRELRDELQRLGMNRALPKIESALSASS
jgi:hypothetical protein